jgi:hypothetical protein
MAALFPGERISLVEGVDAMAARFDSLRNQRPSTCGAYSLSYLLPALGFERHEGVDLAAEDYLAHLAGVVIEDHEVAPSAEVARVVAAGELTEAEAIERFPGVWYRWPMRASADPVLQGTSPMGVARAIAVGTDGSLATLPIAGRDEGGEPQLTPERWEGLLGLLEARLADWRWHGILNYQTDLALKPNAPEYMAEALSREDAAERLPRDDWGVGHFAGLVGVWRRPWGERWLLLMDTYKERGFSGYQPQPAELIRRTLIREDGREGGLLLVVPTDRVREAGAEVERLGVRLRPWSNGSPEPEDWSWELGR